MGTPPNEGTAAVSTPLQLDSQPRPDVQAEANTTSESSSKGLPDKTKPEQAETPAANGTSQPKLNGHSSISNGLGSKPESSAVHEPSPADLLSPVDQPSNHKTAGVESETAALHLGEATTSEVMNGDPKNRPVVDSTDVDTNMGASKDAANKGDTANADMAMDQDDENDPLFSSTQDPEPASASEQAPASNPAPAAESTPVLSKGQEKGEQDVDHDMDAASAPVALNAKPSEAENPAVSKKAPESGEKDKEDHVMEDVSEPAPSSTGEVSTTKVSREREDDDDERAAKRTKTEDISSDNPVTEVSVLPPSSSGEPAAPKTPVTPAHDSANGIPDIRQDMTKAQLKFFTRTFQNLKRLSDAQMFKFPVDIVKLNIPTYFDFVKQPMDLQTMEGKLKSETYRTPQDIIDDFKLMVNNSKVFNGPAHVVSLAGDRLYENFQRQVKKMPGHDEPDITPAEKKSKKVATMPTKTQPPRRETRPPPPTPPPAPVAAAPAPPRASNAGSPTFALGPEGLPLIRRDSTTVDGRPKRSIHPPKNRDLPFSMKPKKKKFQQELKFCQEVLDELHHKKYYAVASFFYDPVDPVALNIPTYHNVIKKPMDLGTMKSKLATGQYENAKEFEADMRQIFKNCYKFNIVGDPVYTAGKQTEEIFDRKWSQKARWLEAHEPASGHQSAGTSDDSSEDEENESDDEQEKLTMLQKQIAEMSKQVEAITKKKKTPPASKKPSKSKAKKEGKRGAAGTAGKKDKKSGGSKAKSEKGRWVTYQEKTMISNGISSLPEHKVQEAFTIIQKNVPSLQGMDGSEIELDIDELPNNVLVTLLKFVKQHAPASVLGSYEEPSEPEPLPSLPPPKPKKSKPMNKTEQEKQIRSLQSNLSKFKGGAGAGVAAAGGSSYEQATKSESSGDDEDSEESEEE
ncbi:bromodomain containing protein [Nannizzia gypsea CBS 118893]|uniref:Bromodomain containing protein n=1 Tax=Arthroderma gypseum (strain ATCC MYA-4604 / CBS 118893) TaxID=535722 RepID=E4V1I4_ARTGP|nr:bromodomain containing protein [Nannizzia gypsea CBS 118893]EFR03899.1 bromodomain containing protein [Nannizzia gypsea CBS 118893]